MPSRAWAVLFSSVLTISHSGCNVQTPSGGPTNSDIVTEQRSVEFEPEDPIATPASNPTAANHSLDPSHSVATSEPGSAASSDQPPASDVGRSSRTNTDSPKDTKDDVSQADGQIDRTGLPRQQQGSSHKAPTEEQIASWGLSQETPLNLLSCSDDFGDHLVECLATSPDGTQFVLGGTKLTLWKTGESKPGNDLVAGLREDDLERPIRSVEISRDGKLLAAGDQKGMLRVWNLNDQTLSLAIRAHDARLIHLAFSPDSRTIATTSYSGEVRMWDASSGSKIKQLPVSERQLSGLAFLTDNLLAIAGEETSLWDVSSGEKTSVLTTGRVIQPALGLSDDRGLLAFVDADSKTHFWDVPKGTLTPLILHDASPSLIEFSRDGKRLATLDQDFNVRIREATTGQIVQVLDTNGGRIVGLKWHPSGALLIASESGQFRIWGTTEMAATLGIEPIPLPAVRSLAEAQETSASSAQLQSVIDIRSLPRLPGAVPQWSDFAMASYQAPATQTEAEQFYRYLLENAGWAQSEKSDQPQSGLRFSKDHCQLNVSLLPAGVPGSENQLQVNLQFAGHYDARTLPRIRPVDSKSDFSSFSFVSYTTGADLTELEVALLQQLHDVGWTPYSRLNASSSEDPLSRTFSLLNKGNVLTVFIRYPADSTEELAVQMNVTVTTKSLPIPPDAGWIEFDSSTDLLMVANTDMNLTETVEFFDREMTSEGWLTRNAGRKIHEDKAWLPYLRGQQDVLIRLSVLPKGGTRITVGDAERSSWQIDHPPAQQAKKGETLLEAADLTLPEGAHDVKFDLDEKQILFELDGTTPQKLATLFTEQMRGLEWKKEDSGVDSDEYVLVTWTKGKKEIQLRARTAPGKTTAMISGDGLAWTKPLPTPPVRISYETWLRRHHKQANLDQLNEFADEMLKIPASKPPAE